MSINMYGLYGLSVNTGAACATAEGELAVGLGARERELAVG